MRIETLVMLGAPLGAMLGNAIAAPSPPLAATLRQLRTGPVFHKAITV